MDLERGVLAKALKQAKAEVKALKLANERLKKEQDALVKHSEVKIKGACGSHQEADSATSSLRQVMDSAKMLKDPLPETDGKVNAELKAFCRLY
uniref:Uncharacterized protein n=1 Tax=Oryza punctata TaxID=4537 RepID=A0A0E0MPD1_ORYPU